VNLSSRLEAKAILLDLLHSIDAEEGAPERSSDERAVDYLKAILSDDEEEKE
jgi:hypothetical protein